MVFATDSVDVPGYNGCAFLFCIVSDSQSATPTQGTGGDIIILEEAAYCDPVRTADRACFRLVL